MNGWARLAALIGIGALGGLLSAVAGGPAGVLWSAVAVVTLVTGPAWAAGIRRDQEAAAR